MTLVFYKFAISMKLLLHIQTSRLNNAHHHDRSLLTVRRQKTFYDVEIPNNICFDINASDLSTPGDSLYMVVSSPHFTSTYTSQPTVKKLAAGYKTLTNRFCWQTTCELSNIGSVTFKSEVKDNGCPLPRTTKSEIVIRIKPMKVMHRAHL